MLGIKMTLDEWFYENELTDLQNDLGCHCDVFCGDEGEELLRMVMTSIRARLQGHERFKCIELENLLKESVAKLGW
jgi:hypothetical protein